MKLANPKLILILATGAALVLGFLAGTISERRISFGWHRVQLNNVQAMLAFNHLQGDRELKTFLAKGCISPAIELVDIAEDKETELIAGFYVSRQIDGSTLKYMSSRDPEIVEKLKAFKSKYGSSWRNPECNS
jgi:hypothetical protein